MAETQYKAGDLNVSITSNLSGASRSLNNIIKKLNSLQTALNGIDTSKLGGIKDAVGGGTRSSGARSGGNGESRQSKGGFSFLNVAKWSAVIFAGRRLGRIVQNIAKAGSDYTETLNLWETAMGSNLDIATEFVKKMNEAYGISEKTLMNAQAIFKNMLGSLGQISDTMAYSLSEGITQMALDYASLYNQTFEQTFTKFQAALAGQVRPIRSVAGYDITETTLYQLYQALGGTKTMRQLTRTEKQLLSILAIFKQMNASGAVGDLDKTMESYANQTRVAAEEWQRVLTYSGVVLTHLIQESGLLTYVNAALIFLGDLLYAVADYMGAIQHFENNIFENTTENALGASDAIDQLQGKLLDFDKFRALNGAEENALGLDETLLQALSSYDTILGDASMKAKEMAESWKAMSGLFGEDGALNIDKWNEIVDIIEAFGHALLAIIASKAITGIIKGIQSLTLSSKGLSNILLTGVIYAFIRAIDAFKDGDIAIGVLSTAIGVTLVGALTALQLRKNALARASMYEAYAQTATNTTLKKYNLEMLKVNKTIATSRASFALLGVGIGVAFAGISTYISNFDKMGDTAKTLIPIFSVLAGVLTSVALALTIMKGNWVKAIGIGAMVTGAGLMVGSTLAAQKFANGGMPDKGTMFVAGEAGAEIVYNTPSGQSGVVNVQQIEQAMYGALTRYGREQGANGQAVVVYLDGEKVYQNTTKHARANGNIWARRT